MRSSRPFVGGSFLRLAAAVFVASPLSGCDSAPPAPPPAPVVSAAPVEASSAAPAPIEAQPLAAPMEEPKVIGATQVLVSFRGAQLAPEGVTRSRDEAKKRADEAYAELMSGSVTLDDLVAKYTDDPAARAAAGRMGNSERYAMPKALGDAAFVLQVGETSQVVETERGFHILRRTK